MLLLYAFAQNSQEIEISADTTLFKVSVIPNPAQQFVLLRFSNPESYPHHLYLVDVHGKLVRTIGDIRTGAVSAATGWPEPGTLFL